MGIMGLAVHVSAIRADIKVEYRKPEANRFHLVHKLWSIRLPKIPFDPRPQSALYSGRHCRYHITFSGCLLSAELTSNRVFVGETVTAMRDGKFQIIGNTQHIAMYTAFCVHGLSEIFVFYRSAVATQLRLEYVS